MRYAFLWCQPNLPSVHNVERRWLTPCPEPRLDVECPEVNLCPRGFLSMSAQPGHREKPRAVFVFSWTFLVMLGCLFPLQKNSLWLEQLRRLESLRHSDVITASLCREMQLQRGLLWPGVWDHAGIWGVHLQHVCHWRKGEQSCSFPFPSPSPSAPFCPGRMEAEETPAGPFSLLRQAELTSDLQSGRLFTRA